MEVSSARACGVLNSRPSTRLGAAAVSTPCCCKIACPTIREGAGLNMVDVAVWASRAAATAAQTVME